MTVFWTRFAEEKLTDIFDYYKQMADLDVAREMVSGIVDHTLSLHKSPFIRQVEELLAHRPQGFRYLVHKHYKLIYWVNDKADRIEISNIFDCRQNPIKIGTET